jgi:sigma-B regulation protein RsbU (phosphoserine phosphatase)
MGRTVLGQRPTPDRLCALRRLSTLSRISGRFADVDDAADLVPMVQSILQRLFEGACRVEIFLTHASSLDLIPSVDPPLGRTLLGILRAESDRNLDAPHLVRAERSPRRASLLSTPLLHRGKPVGLIVVEAGLPNTDFTYPDLDALVSVAAMVTMSLARLRTSAERETQKIYERDLEAARDIQRQFLPSLPSELNGFRIAAEYRPAYVVGGDFYDVVPCGPGAVTAIIGDVSGKGVAAALVMARVSSEFRRLAQTSLSPSDLLAKLNESTLGQWRDDTFITAACVRFDVPGQHLLCANAGHVLPVLRRQSGRVAPIGHDASAPLGVFPGERYRNEEVPLHHGDTLLLMTDGVLEALDCDGDPRRMWRVCSLMAQAPLEPAAIQRRLLAEVDRPRQAERRADDVTLLTVKAVDGRLRSIVVA